MGSFSLWHWLIVLLIVVLVFGTKRLRNMGGDLGSAMRDFKKGLQGDEANPQLRRIRQRSSPARKPALKRGAIRPSSPAPMFDIGFSEIMLIGVIALIVLGPERLPGAARTVGALLRRARSSWANVRAEVERELAAEEIKRNVQETAAAVDPRAAFQAAAEEIKSSQDEVAKSFNERI